MGYPIEESPFAQLVRRQLQRIRGEAYDYRLDPAGGNFMTGRRVPGEPAVRSLSDAYVVINRITSEVRAQEMRPEADRDPVALLASLIELAAHCERAAVDLALCRRD